MDKDTELQIIAQRVQQAAELAAQGSFSQRNPLLGKMVRCPSCGQRRRMFQAKSCCSAALKQGTENEHVQVKGRKIPRLTRNNPPLLEVHEKLLQLERTPGFVEYEGIAGVIEAQIKRRKRAKAKTRRNQQNASRRINRG
jgi:hypothetical protein